MLLCLFLTFHSISADGQTVMGAGMLDQAVEISGYRMAVGASYIFKETSSNAWVQQVKLIPNPAVRYPELEMAVR